LFTWAQYTVLVDFRVPDGLLAVVVDSIWVGVSLVVLNGVVVEQSLAAPLLSLVMVILPLVMVVALA
jgi:hypothetical protein